MYLSHAKRALPFVLHLQDNNVPALPQYRLWSSWIRAHTLIFLQLTFIILTRNKHHTRSTKHWPHVYETLTNNILWWPYYHELNVIMHITAWNYTLSNQHISTQTQASRPINYILLRLLSYVPLHSTKLYKRTNRISSWCPRPHWFNTQRKECILKRHLRSRQHVISVVSLFSVVTASNSK